MVINYKILNHNLNFDRYFIPRKDVLINLTKEFSVFSKFDCKSRFWQLKMIEELKPLSLVCHVGMTIGMLCHSD